MEPVEINDGASDDFEVLVVTYPLTHDVNAPGKDVQYLVAKGRDRCTSNAIPDYVAQNQIRPLLVPYTTQAVLSSIVLWCNQETNVISPGSYNVGGKGIPNLTGTELMASLRAAQFLGITPLFNELCVQFGRIARQIRVKDYPIAELAARYEVELGLPGRFDPLDQVYTELVALLEQQRKDCASPELDITLSRRDTGHRMLRNENEHTPLADSPIQRVISEFITHVRQWESDPPNCMTCNAAFGQYVSGRHHCRACGKVICATCTMSLDEKMFDPICQPGHTLGIKDNVSKLLNCVGLASTQKYVCKPCHKNFTTIQKQEREFFADVIRQSGINVHDVQALLATCPVMLSVCGQYLERMRLLAVSGYHFYTDEDRWLVRANMDLFVGHRNWIQLSILATNWDNTMEQAQCLKLYHTIGKEKEHMCRELLCPRDCCESNSAGLPFQFDQILIILQSLSTYRSDYVEHKLRRPLAKNLENMLANEQLFLLLFPLVLDIIVIYPSECLQNLLMHSAVQGQRQLWYFVIELERRARRCITAAGLVRLMYHHLGMMGMKEEPLLQVQDISAFYLLVECMRVSSKKKTSKEADKCMVEMLLKHDLVEQSSETLYSFRRRIWFPFPPCDDWITQYETGKVAIMASATAPVKFQFKTGRSERAMLWKNEPLVKDSVMCNMMALVNGTLTTWDPPYPAIKSYNVLQTSDEDGIVEWMDNTKSLQKVIDDDPQQVKILGTLHDIKAKRKIESFENFVNSQAVYVTVTYLFGVVDRHLDNIMMCMTDGNIIHIDYGYIFERARTEGFVRYDKHTDQLLKCVEPKYTNQFDDTLLNGYQLLRRLHSLIYILMQHVQRHDKNTKWTPQYIYEEILDRCHPGRSDEYATMQFRKRVLESVHQQGVKDAMHNSRLWANSNSLIAKVLGLMH
jgi:hypothetical protein